MKRIVISIPLVVSTFWSVASAQQARVTRIACGPDNITFNTHQAERTPTAHSVEAGAATVYVFTELHYAGLDVGCQANTRIGIDGKWLGANCGTSYLQAAVTPGEHHLCVDWQKSIFYSVSPRALQGFVAEPGKTYYFHAVAWKIAGVESLDLTAVDQDEGELLLSEIPVSVSKPKH